MMSGVQGNELKFSSRVIGNRSHLRDNAVIVDQAHSNLLPEVVFRYRPIVLTVGLEHVSGKQLHYCANISNRLLISSEKNNFTYLNRQMFSFCNRFIQLMFH